MRLTPKIINDEVRRLGHGVHIEKGDGYFRYRDLTEGLKRKSAEWEPAAQPAKNAKRRA